VSPTPSLRPVPVPELRLLPDGRRWTVEQRLQDLQSLEAVTGWLHVWHHGNQLRVCGQASTRVERPREPLPDNLQSILDQQLAQQTVVADAAAVSSERLPFEPRGKR